MTCEIISTGSVGNAVLLNGKYLFDCGVPYAKLKPYTRGLRAVLLTHVHSDHFNTRTIRRLCQDRPTLRFVCGKNLLVDLVSRCGVPPDRVTMAGKFLTKLEYPDETVSLTAFDLIHNVENIGYLITIDGPGGPERALYATDTCYIPVHAPGLDLYMVENNYSQEALQRRVERKKEAGQWQYEPIVTKSHMSTETVTAWLKQNAAEDSQVVFLHAHIERKNQDEAEDRHLPADDGAVPR